MTFFPQILSLALSSHYFIIHSSMGECITFYCFSVDDFQNSSLSLIPSSDSHMWFTHVNSTSYRVSFQQNTTTSNIIGHKLNLSPFLLKHIPISFPDIIIPMNDPMSHKCKAFSRIPLSPQSLGKSNSKFHLLTYQCTLFSYSWCHYFRSCHH
jgi:hypothetical protein